MSEVIIRYEGNDVIIKGPREILKIVIDPAMSIQRITETTKPDIKITGLKLTESPKPKTGRKLFVYTAKPKVKRDPKPKGKRLTQDDINQIEYLRDEEHMTSAQVAKEMGISIPTCNKYYRPLTSEREIN